MRRSLGFVALAGVLVMAGCWPVSGQNLHRSSHNAVEAGFDAGAVAGFTELWTAHTDEVPGLGRGTGHPVLADDGAVLVTSTHSAYAFDSATGAQRWARTPSPSTYAEVDTDGAVFNGSYYVSLRRTGGSGGVWEPGQFDLADGFWFTGEINGRQEAVRADPFTALFSEFSAPPGSPGAQTAFLFIGGSLRVEVTQLPNSSRLTLGADRIFHAGVGSGTAPANGVRSYPVDGSPGWATPIDGTIATSPVLSDDESVVFVGTDQGTLHALATATGSLLWSTPVGAAVTAPPALAEGVLYVPTASGSLVAVADTGATLWSTSTPAGSAIGVQPAAAAGVVFTGHDDGTLQGFDAAGCGAATCDPVWSTTTGSRITGAPAVSGATVFVGTADGRLVAYGLPAPG